MVEDAQQQEIVCQKTVFNRLCYQSSSNRILINVYRQQNNAMHCALFNNLKTSCKAKKVTQINSNYLNYRFLFCYKLVF